MFAQKAPACGDRKTDRQTGRMCVCLCMVLAVAVCAVQLRRNTDVFIERKRPICVLSHF